MPATMTQYTIYLVRQFVKGHMLKTLDIFKMNTMQIQPHLPIILQRVHPNKCCHLLNASCFRPWQHLLPRLGGIVVSSFLFQLNLAQRQCLLCGTKLKIVWVRSSLEIRICSCFCRGDFRQKLCKTHFGRLQHSRVSSRLTKVSSRNSLKSLVETLCSLQ